MLAVIDNYDSFTYNLVQYFGELQPEYPELLREIKVFRNDRIDIPGLTALMPDLLVISPGPCTPRESGVSLAAAAHFSGRIPVLGICLGHQCIAAAYGGIISRAPAPVHGKLSQIRHNGQGLFRGLPQPFAAVRYHSLVVAEEGFPEVLEITARTDDGLIMGLAHREHPTFGLQFHPESYFTDCGKEMLRNFVEQAKGKRRRLKNTRGAERSVSGMFGEIDSQRGFERDGDGSGDHGDYGGRGYTGANREFFDSLAAERGDSGRNCRSGAGDAG